MGKYIKIKGFLIQPSILSHSSKEDIDDLIFFEGEELEKALMGLYTKIEIYKCLKCNKIHLEKEDVLECCEK